MTCEYREGPYVGYRYFDKTEKPVEFPFGFGLSYTKFEYSDLSADENGVTFTIKNVGDCDGAEIAQMYVGKPTVRFSAPQRNSKVSKRCS